MVSTARRLRRSHFFLFTFFLVNLSAQMILYWLAFILNNLLHCNIMQDERLKLYYVLQVERNWKSCRKIALAYTFSKRYLFYVEVNKNVSDIRFIHGFFTLVAVFNLSLYFNTRICSDLYVMKRHEAHLYFLQCFLSFIFSCHFDMYRNKVNFYFPKRL